MADATPTNVVSVIKNHLREALAANSDFKTLTGTATVETARLRVRRDEIQTEPDKPYVAIRDVDLRYEAVAVATPLLHGSLRVRIIGEISSAYRTSSSNAQIERDNEAGALFEILQTIGNGTDVSGTRMFFNVQYDEPAEFELEETSDDNQDTYQFWHAGFLLTWNE